MTFPPAGGSIPTEIGNIYVTIIGTAEGCSISAEVFVIDQLGRTLPSGTYTCELEPHITAKHTTAINDFMVYLRNKMTTEMLP